MRLHYLELINFKNHASRQFSFRKKIIALTGLNGSGKTNVLDAIYYLCFTKSYFNRIEVNNVKHSCDFFRISSKWTGPDAAIPIDITYEVKNKRKKISCDGLKYKKLSEHIGKIPVVMIAPDDQILILQFSEERRRYLDVILSQIDKEYLEKLNAYNKTLKQRNASLKSFIERQYFDSALISGYNIVLADTADYIFKKRNELFLSLKKKLSEYYQQISNHSEIASLNYESQLYKMSMQELLEESIEVDRLTGRTSRGIHKDDLIFSINDSDLKKYGSQGQQKSFLLSLKLAQLDLLYEHSHTKPVIIIDDIFAKLDEERVRSLLSVINSEKIAQAFISDTSRERIENLFVDNSDKLEIFEITKIDADKK